MDFLQVTFSDLCLCTQLATSISPQIIFNSEIYSYIFMKILYGYGLKQTVMIFCCDDQYYMLYAKIRSNLRCSS